MKVCQSSNQKCHNHLLRKRLRPEGLHRRRPQTAPRLFCEEVQQERCVFCFASSCSCGLLVSYLLFELEIRHFVCINQRYRCGNKMCFGVYQRSPNVFLCGRVKKRSKRRKKPGKHFCFRFFILHCEILCLAALLICVFASIEKFISHGSHITYTPPPPHFIDSYTSNAAHSHFKMFFLNSIAGHVKRYF